VNSTNHPTFANLVAAKSVHRASAVSAKIEIP